MTVVNSEYAKNVGLNGRIGDNVKLVFCTLLPGLNNVSEDEIEMLRANQEFELHCAMGKFSVVEHQDKDEPVEPETIDAIDITSMSIPKAGQVINSAVMMDLLDRFVQQEEGGDNRKGIFGLIETQRKLVQDVLDKQEASKKTPKM